MSKSSGIYNKANTYLVRVADETACEMNFKNNRQEFLVQPGKHSVEIGNEIYFQKEEVVLKAGETKVLIINPSCTFNLGRGIMIGIVATGIVIQFAILQKLSPLLILNLIPLFYVRKSNFENSFGITQSS
ncbi:hypothetical protein [Flavobacterium fryxellicola]|uniref:Uncharacterized protein n=1 Tax=Flavobacterium fryxellicola TaxID=249352 RepID=A0A167XPU7_9FLAO|nr:hypothetical protein [Flavobacterium fryxellicola]OAB28576.1 hypothetical protein FBFR_07750 [Flavobacterium fryxellicola]